MIVIRTLLAVLLISVVEPAFCQQASWKNIETGIDASFRGLSVIDDQVAWVSGTKGTIGLTTDGGGHWTFTKVRDHEQMDFRSLYAFSSKKAVVANAGSPAVILTTADGGTTWTEVYRNTDTAAFFDGIGFWNDSEGIIYGDPIGDRMVVMHTADGGQNWKMLPDAYRPELRKGEASFAASGTAIRCLSHKKVAIATGGTVSRILFSDNRGHKWEATPSPLIQGLSTTGTFSIAFSTDERNAIMVGGDYKRDTLRTKHVFYAHEGAFKAPIEPTRGYRECVEFVRDGVAIATGPSGTDITYDWGAHWRALNDERGLHVARKARDGNRVILAGSNGKIVLADVR